MSPRYAGQRFHWDLSPEDIISGSLNDDEITHHPRFSREGWSHLGIYRQFPDAQAVVHGHAFHIMPFASLSIPIESVLEGNDKFGLIEVAEPAPAHSKELAEKILACLAGKEERIRKMAAAVILPRHGIIVVGKDLDFALDALERIDTAAWCILARGPLTAK
jgi:L-fuculose-phosphate aldolase